VITFLIGQELHNLLIEQLNLLLDNFAVMQPPFI